jgi:hypothetical protein
MDNIAIYRLLIGELPRHHNASISAPAKGSNDHAVHMDLAMVKAREHIAAMAS